jgi:cell division protein FtsI/penicillin-binding protein 2
LILGDPLSSEWTLPGTAAEWASIRRGVYGVVSDTNGTAHKYAHFVHDRYALCGKTGSATAAPRPTAYRVPYWDEYHHERVDVIKEGAKGPALERFRKRHPLATFDLNRVDIASRWPATPPAEGGNHAHAWFAGFLQRLDSHGQPDWTQTPSVAFAALVEFGGSGGRTSGPLAKEIAAVLLEVLGPDLDAHREGASR